MMSYTDNLKVPTIVLTNARKNGVCKWRQDSGIVCLVYSNGTIQGPFSEKDADEIISATKDFRKKQEQFQQNRVMNIRHNEHKKNIELNQIVAKNCRNICANILRKGR
jgi:hypothetical protein